jgi:hypothetical protein
MRQLSVNQANRCETAKNKRCRCRCNGAAHGAGRGSGKEFFNQLPEEDPHMILSEVDRERKRLEQVGQKTLPTNY